jgi:esterase/lipase superfamily enzyme
MVFDGNSEGDSLLVSLSSVRGDYKNINIPYAVVKVFYATDRNLSNGGTPNTVFGTERSSVRFGECDVSIPRDHKMGEIEKPAIWRLEFKEDPDKHVVLRKVQVTSRADFFKNIKGRLNESAQKSAMIFVHGYNVSFADAALQTAQLSYDLGFDGAPVFYSWPSKSSYLGYTADEATIELSQIRLRIFLENFLMNTDVQNLYLIAHSMGNRALTRAIASLIKDKPELKSRFTEIILTAPDIDVDVFKEDIAPALVKVGKPITLYTSSTDEALNASKILHGNISRIGDTSTGIVVIDGIETIDATNVNTSFIGHSYFGESRSVLSDLFIIIKNRLRPANRPSLESVNYQSSNYWRFRR